MAAATQNTDETLASTDDQTTIKQKATRSKTNKTTEAQNTQTGDDKSSDQGDLLNSCLLYTSPSPRDLSTSRMPSSA